MSARFRRKIRTILELPNYINDSGAAAVEMAAVFPVFLTIALIIVASGLYFGAAHSVQQLAADAARASIPGLNSTERASLSQAFVTKNVSNYPILRSDKIKVATNQTSAASGDVVVTVSYDARYLPIWGFAKFIPLPASQIVRTSVIHRGGPQ